jgi:hypothetical protein
MTSFKYWALKIKKYKKDAVSPEREEYEYRV